MGKGGTGGILQGIPRYQWQRVRVGGMGQIVAGVAVARLRFLSTEFVAARRGKTAEQSTAQRRPCEMLPPWSNCRTRTQLRCCLQRLRRTGEYGA